MHDKFIPNVLTTYIYVNKYNYKYKYIIHHTGCPRMSDTQSQVDLHNFGSTLSISAL